jgi:hypothetical protein
VTICAPAPAATKKLGGFTVKPELLLVMFETVRVAFPVFPTVNVCWLDVPAATFPNAIDELENETIGAGPVTPAPDSEISVGVPAAL